MDERRRRYYLTALGIDPWCARWPLPGGAPSPERPPEPHESVEPVKPAVSLRRDAPSSQDPVVKGQRASLDAMRDALDNQETQQSVEPPAEDIAGDREPDPMPSGELKAMIWHDDRFSLMASSRTDLPSERQNGLGCNILRALGASGDADASMVRWPPFDNPELPGNNADNLQRVLEQVMAGSASGRWIILGAEVHSMIEQRLASGQQEIVLAAEQTLGDLLGEPAAKRRLWEQMRPLIGAGRSREA